ncbi:MULTISPECIES: TatD family hydrolase [Oceanimonas]|uniref:TatD family hydrolase n=1 Tax=Oceanimonas smirnovii TaxID=264574 RepID=A0ABW7P0T0_9GAMM|nr:TatD family hydrolase [Oceanimonas sp. CAM02]MDV2859023.1 TatD family hydrolase [Oceanimonas sp. CAM02]
MKLTDTHCHFDFDAFADNRAGHWQRAQAAGVHRLLIPGVEEAQWPGLPRLCRQLPGTRYALGLHPWWLKTASDQWQQKLITALNSAGNDCVAIGETGLDMACKVPMEKQEYAFVFQLRLACERGLPVVMHSHKTHDVLLKWLRRYPPVGGVVHGFAGSLQQAQNFWKLGIHIGVGGTITYERAQKTRNTMAAMPAESLVLETDAPDMPLCGFQGQPNHPERLPLVLQALADIRQQPLPELALTLEQNAARLLQW